MLVEPGPTPGLILIWHEFMAFRSTLRPKIAVSELVRARV